MRGIADGQDWERKLGIELQRADSAFVVVDDAMMTRFVTRSGEDPELRVNVSAREIVTMRDRSMPVIPLWVQEPGGNVIGKLREAANDQGLSSMERQAAKYLLTLSTGTIDAEELRKYPEQVAHMNLVKLEDLARQEKEDAGRTGEVFEKVGRVAERKGEILPGIREGDTYAAWEIREAVEDLAMSGEDVIGIIVSGDYGGESSSREISVRGVVVENEVARGSWTIDWTLSAGGTWRSLNADSDTLVKGIRVERSS